MTEVPADPAALLLRGGTVLTEDGRWVEADVVVEGGRVTAVLDRGTRTTDPEVSTLDVGGQVVAPGLIDTHVHGRRGQHVMTATGTAVDAVGRALADEGVTSYLATTATVPFPELLDAVSALAGQVGTTGSGAAELLGTHLEGPFLSPDHRGVHPATELVDPTPERLTRLLDAAAGTLRVCTIAPELPGGLAAVATLDEASVVPSVGHTSATFDQTRQAIDAGARRATHLFNAMPPIHHRSPGPVPALLRDPRVHVELVADGRHVDPALLATLLEIPTVAATAALVSDGTEVAGLPDGRYRRFEGTEVEMRDGVARTLQGGLAGGTASLADGVRNAVRAGVPLARALQAAARNPANSLGISDRGRITPGAVADLIVLDPSTVTITTTIVRGTRRAATKEP